MPDPNADVGDVLAVGLARGVEHLVVQAVRECPFAGDPHRSYQVGGPVGLEWICHVDIPLTLYAKPV